MDKNLTRTVTRYLNFIFSVFIFVAILVLIAFTGVYVYRLVVTFAYSNSIDVIHNLALLIVLVKAYRVLLFYFWWHHISIKYIVEISIIAPAIEIIFAYQNQPIVINVLFGLFSLASLWLYLKYYDKLTSIDNKEGQDTSVLMTKQ